MQIIYIDVMNDDESRIIGDHRHENLYLSIQANIYDEFRNTEAAINGIHNACKSISEGLITFSGHGDFDYVNDYHHHNLFHVNDNLNSLVSDKIVHLHACFTGEGLGPEMVANGCKAFFGYNDYFIAPHEDDPQYDLIEHFMDPDKVLVEQLNEGISAGTAATAALKAYDKAIEEIDKTSTNGNYQVFIRDNKEAFCYPDNSNNYGDPNATLTFV